MVDRPVPVYQSVAVADPDNCGNVVRPNADGSVNVEGTINVTINPGDFEIGAVEIKDATTNNRVAVSAAGLLSVDGSAVVQPVSATALPLPSGAATSAGQASALSEAQTTNTLLGSAATSALQGTGNTALAAILAAVQGATPAGGNVIGHVIFDNASLAVTGNFYQATQPVSAASLPLPSNAAQEAGGNLASINANTSVLTSATGKDDDSVVHCLNSIQALLQSVNLLLRELPLNIAVALNQTLNVSGGPIRYSTLDSFESMGLDSTSQLSN